jgi:heterodisulfide reductase subunit C
MSFSQIAFIFLLVISIYFAVKQFSFIIRNIKLGKDYDTSGNVATRWANVILVAFGQKKMFKRIVPAVMHGFIYVAFLFTQIELIEILVDGLFGVHRFFAPYLGWLYTAIIGTIELLSILAFIGTVVFIIRRNLIKVPRLHNPEMKGWPTMDANIILGLEILLLIGIFTMNGADIMLQKLDPVHYPSTGFLPVSSIMGPLFLGGFNEGVLVVLERAGWWLHFLVVLGFLYYIPRSKHLHIFFAFPNVYFAPQQSRGEMDNMPAVMTEVKSMMGLIPESEMPAMDAELPEFGAKDVFDLPWKTLLDAYTCTECGRCTSVCPANITGKKLSPRKVLMDIRDRAEEVGRNIDSGLSKYVSEADKTAGVAVSAQTYDDGKNLFDYITREELHACTTCNACVEACPVMINPLNPILALRRYEILTESAGPSEWVPMFTSIENGGAVWQIPDDRDKWAKEFAANE